jgi:hypothetical protein
VLQRAQLTRKLDEANARLDEEYISKAKATLELAKRAKLLWFEQSAHEKRRFLELVLSNAQLDGEGVRYTLRKPFAILAEMRGSADWRTRAEEFRLRSSPRLDENAVILSSFRGCDPIRRPRASVSEESRNRRDTPTPRLPAGRP